MRPLATADLHYNHRRGKGLAERVIGDINAAGGDVLLVIGDVATADGDLLERCLDLFRFPGPKLFLAGNHDLWTAGSDSYRLFTEILPRRIRDLGWQWLETEPFIRDGWAIVGTIGWYDYSFAHARSASPNVLCRQSLPRGRRALRRIPPSPRRGNFARACQSFAGRWNDGRFSSFTAATRRFSPSCWKSSTANSAIPAGMQILAATHHLPFRSPSPPPRIPQWDFAHAYLGSEKLGELLLRHPAVKLSLSGHSHFPAEATVGQIRAINIGSGYRVKTFALSICGPLHRDAFWPLIAGAGRPGSRRRTEASATGDDESPNALPFGSRLTESDAILLHHD